DGAIGVAAGRAIRAGEVAHRVSHVRVRIEQPGSGAAIAHGARRPQADLHQPIIAAADRARIVTALAHDDAVDQRWRNPVRLRMGDDHGAELAPGGADARGGCWRSPCGARGNWLCGRLLPHSRKQWRGRLLPRSRTLACSLTAPRTRTLLRSWK